MNFETLIGGIYRYIDIYILLSYIFIGALYLLFCEIFSGNQARAIAALTLFGYFLILELIREVL